MNDRSDQLPAIRAFPRAEFLDAAIEDLCDIVGRIDLVPLVHVLAVQAKISIERIFMLPPIHVEQARAGLCSALPDQQ